MMNIISEQELFGDAVGKIVTATFEKSLRAIEKRGRTIIIFCNVSRR